MPADTMTSYRERIEASISDRLAGELARLATMLDKHAGTSDEARALGQRFSALAEFCKEHPHLIVAATKTVTALDTGMVPYLRDYDAAADLRNVGHLADLLHAAAQQVVLSECTYPSANRYNELALVSPISADEMAALMAEIDEPATMPEILASMEAIRPEHRSARP